MVADPGPGPDGAGTSAEAVRVTYATRLELPDGTLRERAGELAADGDQRTLMLDATTLAIQALDAPPPYGTRLVVQVGAADLAGNAGEVVEAAFTVDVLPAPLAVEAGPRADNRTAWFDAGAFTNPFNAHDALRALFEGRGLPRVVLSSWRFRNPHAVPALFHAQLSDRLARPGQTMTITVSGGPWVEAGLAELVLRNERPGVSTVQVIPQCAPEGSRVPIYVRGARYDVGGDALTVHGGQCEPVVAPEAFRREFSVAARLVRSAVVDADGRSWIGPAESEVVELVTNPLTFGGDALDVRLRRLTDRAGAPATRDRAYMEPVYADGYFYDPRPTWCRPGQFCPNGRYWVGTWYDRISEVMVDYSDSGPMALSQRIACRADAGACAPNERPVSVDVLTRIGW